MRLKRWLIGGLLSVAIVLGCQDDVVRPPTGGTIAVRLVFPQSQASADSADVSADSTGAIIPAPAADDLPGPAPSGVQTLEAVRVTATAGSTVKALTVSTATGANFDVTLTEVPAGSYTVTVEGLIGGEVSYYGSTTGVAVTVGQVAQATVPFTPFEAVAADFGVPSTAMTLAVTWPAVTNAQGYVLESDRTAAFSNAIRKSVTGTNSTVSASDTGTTYVRVRATNSVVPLGGRPGAAKAFRVIREASDSTDAAAGARDLGFAVVANGTISANIAPLGDVDWFAVKVCQGDSLIANAKAVRLTPSSPLNTQLDFYSPSNTTTPVATNNDADSTDAVIRYLVAASGKARIRVSSANNTVGNYDLVITVKSGSRNTGTVCQNNVNVTGSATIGAIGGTSQLSAQLMDSDGNPITGATFTWASSAPSVATVSNAGLVTAVDNGNADITATTSGLSSPRTVTVLQVVSQVAITPPGATIVTLGGTQALTAEPQDANAHPVAGKTVTWATLNPAVVSIGGTGTVTSVTAGQAAVSATSDGVPGYSVITVAPPTGTPVNDWSSSPSGTVTPLHAIWGASDTDVFAVGDGGVILHYNGTAWSSQTSPTTQPLNGVWGSSGINAIAVGSGGTILRYNGSSWTQMTSPTTEVLQAAWGAGPNAVFAVGNTGTILRFDGTAWTSMTSGTTQTLRAVWGASLSNVFAAGDNGTILRFNGTAWSAMTNTYVENLWGAWGFSSSEVYAVGLSGRILKYNGTSWANLPSGTVANLRDVWGTSGTDVYAVGDGGTVIRYNGTSWSPSTSGTTALLEGVWGTQFVNSVFGVGSGGSIAHGQRFGVVDSVDVTPGTPSFDALGLTQQLSAAAFDPGHTLLPGRQFAWVSKDEAVVTVNATGLITTVGNGATYVRATTAAKSDSALVTVAQVIMSVDVTPGNPIVAVGNSAQLFATAKDPNNHAVAGATFTWGSSDNAKASVNPAGVVTAFEGTATITATSTNNLSGSTDVTASNVPVATVTVSPVASTIPGSGTVQLTATARDAGNGVLNGRAFVWSSNLPSVADVDQNGLVTGSQAGDAVITATSEGKSGTAAVSVSGSVVSSVVVTPSPNTLTAIGATVQLDAEAQDPAHNPIGGKAFTWVSNNPSIATVDATGLVTAVGPGSTNIVATTDGVSGNGAITVSQTVASVQVIPATGNVGIGQSSQLSVIAKDANDHVVAIPPTAAWSTSDPDKATITGGLVGAVAVGTVTITATISGHSGTSDITIVPVAVATVDVTPAPTTVGEGLTVQLTATTKDGSSNVLTGRVVSWSSSNANATVDASGLVTGVAPGTATITATSEGKTGTSVVTITARTVNSIVLTPRGATVTVPGGNQQFTADAQDNLAQSIPGKVFTWASLNPTVATVDAASGVASVVSNGQVTVSASVDGKTGYALVTAATGASPVTLWDAETSNTTAPLRGVWGSSANDIFAVGGTGGAAAIQRFDGSSWAAMTIGSSAVLEGVWGTASDNVFAVGSGGAVLRYDGSSWAGMTGLPAGTPQLNDVWGAGPTVVYAVGAAGTIWRYTGTAWTSVTPVTGQDLYAIWGSASNDIWAVGNAGTVLHFCCGVSPTWTAATDGSENLRGVWGTGPNDVFTVSASGTIRHWNGSWGPSGTAGAALNAIYGSSSTDVYAVGVSGTIVRFDGNNWDPMVSGTAQDLFSTWSRSGRVLAVGATGTIRHGYRGATVLVSPSNPTLVTLETTTQLTAEARDAQNALIPGRVFTWDTDNHSIATVDATGLVTAHLGGTAIVTATTGGLNGSTNGVVAQVPVTITLSPSNPPLNAFGASVQLAGEALDAGNFVIPGQTFIWESSDDAIATVSASGLVQAVSNGPVTITAGAQGASGNTLVTVAQVTASVAVTPAGATITGGTQAFSAEALDANGYVIAGKTFAWSGINDAIATVNGSGVATPVANGQMNVKASVDGKDGYGLLTVATAIAPAVNAWAAVNSTTANALNGIWGAASNDLHAVGLNGVTRRYTGAWGAITSASADDLFNIWGSSTSDVYAVGGFGTRILVHFNGSAWAAVPGVPAGGELHGVWGSSPADIYAAGLNGSILHFDGSSWTSVTSPTGNRLESVWASSKNDVWMVGYSGTVVHYNGSSWTVENPVAENLFAVWGDGPNNVWAVGASGRIIHYTGTWSPVASPTGRTLNSVWGTSDNDVYAVSATDTIIRYNGSDWVVAGAAPGLSLDGLFGIGSAAYFGASNGDVLNAYRGATVTVSPSTPTLATLVATQAMTASVNGGGVTGVPIVWTSSDPYVATVDPTTGVVSAVGRGAVTITATAAGGATGTTTVTVTAVRVARIDATAGGNLAANAAFGTDLVGTIGNLSVASFNAMSPADLRAAYDVLLFVGAGDYNGSWSTRMQPYLELGGGIIYEDPYSNMADLAPAVVAASSFQSTFAITASVPGLTDGIGTGFVNGHIRFDSWDPNLTPFITSGAETTGLYGRFGSGCIALTSPDNDYHGLRGAGGQQGNMYNLLLNEIKWTADCPLTGVAGPPASVVITPNGGTLTAYNQTRQFTAAVFDAVGNPIASPTITWQSSDPSVMSVSGSGTGPITVTAIAGNGAPTLTAAVTGGANPSSQVTVTINQPTATLTVTPLGAAITSGTQVFTAVARNSNGDVLNNKTFTWSSGLTSVATLAPSGGLNTTATATAALSGQSVIAAAVEGKTASGLLTVAATPATPVNVWSSTPSGTSNYVQGIWSAAPNNIFAVGDGGVLLRYTGSWAPMAGSGTFVTGCCVQGLLSVWGSSPTNLFAVGGGGVILRYTGTWSQMPQSGVITTATLYRVWGSSATDVYAVGTGGTMIHFDGSTWSTVAHGLGTPLFLGIWGTAANDVYVAGQGGVVIHFNGTSWANVPHGQGSPGYGSGVSGTGPDNIFVGTYAGSSNVFRCTGGSCAAGSGWSSISGATLYNWGTFATASTEVFAMGNGISRYNGSGSFTPMTIPSSVSLYNMAGDQTNSLWVVGSGGTILRGVRGAAPTTFGWGASLPIVSGTGTTGTLWASAITVASKTELQSLSQYLESAPAGQTMLALYTDNGGLSPADAPLNLVAQTGIFSMAGGAGSYSAPVLGSQVQVLPGKYWLVAAYQVGVAFRYDGSGGIGYRSAAWTWGPTFPGTFPASGLTNAGYRFSYSGSGFAVP